MLLQQTSRFEASKLGSGLDKLGHLKIRMNTELIQDDIGKVKALAEQANRISQLKYLRGVEEYLKMLLKKSLKKQVNLQWTFIDNRVRAFPFEIKQFKKIQIQATDYIVMNGVKMLSFEYEHLLNMLAFDIVHREFGFTFEDIEKELSSISLLSVQDCSILYDKELLTPNTYNIALEMAVEDSPHLDMETHEITDYFGIKHEPSKYYREAILASRDMAMNILLQQLLTKAIQKGFDIKLAGVFDDSLYFVVPISNAEEIQTGLQDSLEVRIFGRIFELNPIIKLY